MIKRRIHQTESAQGQKLAQRQQALAARRTATQERLDVGPAFIAQIVAEIAVMEADLGVEIDEWFMAEELAAAQALAEAAGIWAEEAVAAASSGA